MTKEKIINVLAEFKYCKLNKVGYLVELESGKVIWIRSSMRRFTHQPKMFNIQTLIPDHFHIIGERV